MTNTDGQESLDLRNTLVAAALLATLIGMFGYMFGGKLVAEKSLALMTHPVGGLWLLLAGWTLQFLATQRIRLAIVPSLIWLGLTLCSTPPLVDACNRYLEVACLESSGMRLFNPSTDAPLDTLIVLGGGVTEGRERAQAGQSGDRIVYAAELYYQGHARQLITTGDATPTFGNRQPQTQSELTTEILTKLGIPPEAIGKLHGLNTFEEIQSIKEIMTTQLSGQRVGILTSALHLPRALRLARAQGLDDLIPVAADYLISDQPRSFDLYLPRADTLCRFARCQHELLAGLFAR